MDQIKSQSWYRLCAAAVIELDPRLLIERVVGNWIAPPGSNRSGGGGNKAAGASGVEGRIRRLGESAGCNARER